MRLALLGGGVEELLDLAELPVAADEGRLEPGRLERAAGARDDPQRPPERHEPVLPLQLEGARLLVDDRLLGGAPCRLADENRAGLGDRLHARRRVDEVAGDHPLPLGAERDRGLAGKNARAGRELGRAELLAERRDGGDEVERGANGPLGVVLGRRRRPPDRHHRVADELLDRSTVEADQPAAGVEVAREQLAHLLRVARLGERREADQIRKQHRHQTTLSRRSLTSSRRDRRSRRRRVCRQRRAALAAEPLPRRIDGPAGGTKRSKGAPARAAEPLPGGILGAAVRTRAHI